LAHVITRAFAPEPPHGVADHLVLELWDEEATGVGGSPFPRGEESAERPGPEGERLAFAPSGHVRFSGPDFDIRLDREAGHAIGWVRDVKALSSWHRARPLQTLLMAWVAGRGRTVVHAAMVAREGAGVLLCGPAHSGKSTTTGICAAAGLDVLGDETVALEPRGDALIGHSVHAAVKLRHDGLERHPALVAHAEELHSPFQDESVIFLAEAFPQQVVDAARVAALGFPVLSEAAETTFAPFRRSTALRVLTGSMLSVEPGNVASSFDQVSEAIALVPAYRIEIGTETARVPDAISALLAEAVSPVRA
jgi:hypothetical protein